MVTKGIIKEVATLDLSRRAVLEKLAKFDGVIDPNLHAWVVMVITFASKSLTLRFEMKNSKNILYPVNKLTRNTNQKSTLFKRFIKMFILHHKSLKSSKLTFLMCL